MSLDISAVPIDFNQPGFRKIQPLIASGALSAEDAFKIGGFNENQLRDLSAVLRFGVLNTPTDDKFNAGSLSHLREPYYRARFRALDRSQRVGIHNAIIRISQNTLPLHRQKDINLIQGWPSFAKKTFGLTPQIAEELLPIITNIYELDRRKFALKKEISALQSQLLGIDDQISGLLMTVGNPPQ